MRDATTWWSHTKETCGLLLHKTLTEGLTLSRPRRSLSSEPLERRVEQTLKPEFWEGIASELPAMLYWARPVELFGASCFGRGGGMMLS